MLIKSVTDKVWITTELSIKGAQPESPAYQGIAQPDCEKCWVDTVSASLNPRLSHPKTGNTNSGRHTRLFGNRKDPAKADTQKPDFSVLLLESFFSSIFMMALRLKNTKLPFY